MKKRLNIAGHRYGKTQPASGDAGAKDYLPRAVHEHPCLGPSDRARRTDSWVPFPARVVAGSCIDDAFIPGAVSRWGGVTSFHLIKEGLAILVLTIRRGQRFKIGQDIEVQVVDVSGDKIRVGVSAPKSLPILRETLSEEAVMGVLRRAEQCESTTATCEGSTAAPEGASTAANGSR